MLLTIAGRCNAGGMIFLTENIPYDINILSAEIGFEVSTVKLAIDAFLKLGMIICDENEFSICGWEEYQADNRIERIREYQKKYHRKYREKQKLLADGAKLECKVYGKDCSKTEENVAEEKIKKKKEKANDIFEAFAGVDDDLLNALKEYDTFRKLKKKPMTDNARKRLLVRLKTFPQEKWIAILHQTIDNGWADIYPLKGDNDGKSVHGNGISHTSRFADLPDL